MRYPLITLLVLAGIASVFLTYFGANAVDVVVSTTYAHLLGHGSLHAPLPRPVNYIHAAAGAALLAAFAYFAALRVLAVLKI